MRAAKLCSSLTLLVFFCTGCLFHKSSPPPQAQAPPLQTGKGTLNPPKTAQQQPKTETPLASPLPPPSAQNVPLPPPPAPPAKKPKHKAKPPATKPADTQTAAASGASPPSASSAQTAAQATPPLAPATVGTPSPIGQLTTGDSAMEEKTKRATVDLISETHQGLAGIKRPLSTEEKATAAQILTFLKQAQQALDNGDNDGARGLATKAKQLLDELTKP